MNLDKGRIDSHKLIFHPRRVADWLEGNVVYPINMEVCIMGACNHRCIFCCCDYMEHKPDMLSFEILEKTFSELSPLGLKSVLFAGSGEPVLHPRFADVVMMTKEQGIDVAVSTNGVLLTPTILDSCMESISWIRFSVSAGTEERYLKIHRGRSGDFQRVLDNISYAAELKKKKQYHTVLNVQIVMIPDNVDEIVILAEKVKACGADRYIVKSYGDNFLMENDIQEANQVFFSQNDSLYDELMRLNDEKFSVVYRKNRIQNEFSARPYHSCLAADFHACICADGSVCPCCHLQGMDNFVFGNINQDAFDVIWRSSRRSEVMEHIKASNLKPCPSACKLDVMNRYLEELVHPDEHVNFI